MRNQSNLNFVGIVIIRWNWPKGVFILIPRIPHNIWIHWVCRVDVDSFSFSLLLLLFLRLHKGKSLSSFELKIQWNNVLFNAKNCRGKLLFSCNSLWWNAFLRYGTFIYKKYGHRRQSRKPIVGIDLHLHWNVLMAIIFSANSFFLNFEKEKTHKQC